MGKGRQKWENWEKGKIEIFNVLSLQLSHKQEVAPGPPSGCGTVDTTLTIIVLVLFECKTKWWIAMTHCCLVFSVLALTMTGKNVRKPIYLVFKQSAALAPKPFWRLWMLSTPWTNLMERKMALIWFIVLWHEIGWKSTAQKSCWLGCGQLINQPSANGSGIGQENARVERKEDSMACWWKRGWCRGSVCCFGWWGTLQDARATMRPKHQVVLTQICIHRSLIQSGSEYIWEQNHMD